MVSCPKCTMMNTLDSLFCRKCGSTLPVDVVQEEVTKLKQLVATGMESFQNGNTDEAMAIAEHAILSNPSYAEAYALKGMVHERKGQYAEALDAYETVVSLNPDSTIDKIKLNQLRNAFAQRQAAPAEPDRKTAVMMSVAAIVLTFCVGYAAFRMSSNSTVTTKPATDSNLVANNAQNFGGQNSGAVNNPSGGSVAVENFGRTVPQSPGIVSPDDVPAMGASTGNPEDENNSGLPAPNRNTLRGSIRRTPNTGNYQGGTGGDRPSGGRSRVSDTTDPNGRQINPIPSPNDNNSGFVNEGPRVTQSGGTQNSVDPDPAPSANRGGDNPGEISVIVTQPGTTSNGQRALENAGNQRMQGGDIEGASKAFSSATQRGSSSAKVLQRAAQTAARQGRNTEAASTYERAIAAYEKELNSGKGDQGAIKAALNTCRQALKNLKSN